MRFKNPQPIINVPTAALCFLAFRGSKIEPFSTQNRPNCGHPPINTPAFYYSTIQWCSSHPSIEQNSLFRIFLIFHLDIPLKRFPGKLQAVKSTFWLWLYDEQPTVNPMSNKPGIVYCYKVNSTMGTQLLNFKPSINQLQLALYSFTPTDFNLMFSNYNWWLSRRHDEHKLLLLSCS